MLEKFLDFLYFGVHLRIRILLLRIIKRSPSLSAWYKKRPYANQDIGWEIFMTGLEITEYEERR